MASEDQDVNLSINPEIEPEFDSFDYGSKVSFGTQGSPYLGGRYAGQSEIPYPGAEPPPPGVSVGPSWNPRNPGAASSPAYGNLANDDFPSVGSGPWNRPKDIPLSRDEAMAMVAAESNPGVPVPGRFAAMRGRFTDELHSQWGPLNLAFAGMTLAQNGEKYFTDTDSGRYITPEQQATDAAGFLPGVGAVGGTLLGMAVGNGWAGGMAGQAAGQFAEGIIGANDSRAQTTRQIGDELSSATGAIRDFTAQIQASGAALQSLQQGVSAAGGLGTFNAASTIPGVGALSATFGEHNAQDWQTIAKYAGNPLLQPTLGSRFASGAATSDDIASLGYDAAESGDFSGLKTLQQAQSDARLKNDPVFQAASRHVEDARKSQLGLGALPVAFAQWAHDNGNWLHNDITNALDTEDARRRTLGADPDTAAQNALVNQMASLRDRSLMAQSDIATGEAGLSLVRVRGGSADDITTAGAPYLASLAAGRTAAMSESAQYTADLNTPEGLKRSDELKAKIADANARAAGFDVQAASFNRDTTLQGLSERDSAFRLGNLTDTLSGRTNAQQAAGDSAYYQGLISESRTLGYLSPAQRDALESEGRQGVYQVQQNVFSERLDINAISQGRAGVSLARAEASGGPGAIAGAQGQEIEALGARLRELSKELQTAGQTAGDYRREQQELNQVTAQGVSAVAARRQEYFTGVEGIDTANESAARAGLSRAVAIGGNSAFSAVTGLDRQSVFDLTAAYNAAPVGSHERAAAGAALAQARATQAQDVTDLQTFSPALSQRSADLTARTNYQVARDAPWSDGSPGSNPFMATGALLSQDQRDLNAARANDRNVTDPLARYANQQYESQLQVEMAGLRRDQLTAGLDMLPSLVAGLPGRGYGAATLPIAGISAFFGGNPMVSGTFGPAHGEPPVTIGSAMAGGRAGGFGAATGADTTQILLRSILNAIEKGNGLGKSGGATNTLGAKKQQTDQTISVYRR